MPKVKAAAGFETLPPIFSSALTLFALQTLLLQTLAVAKAEQMRREAARRQAAATCAFSQGALGTGGAEAPKGIRQAANAVFCPPPELTFSGSRQPCSVTQAVRAALFPRKQEAAQGQARRALLFRLQMPRVNLMLLGNWGSVWFLRIPPLGNSEWCGAPEHTHGLQQISQRIWLRIPHFSEQTNLGSACRSAERRPPSPAHGGEFTLEGARQTPSVPFHRLPSTSILQLSALSCIFVGLGCFFFPPAEKDKYLQLLLLEPSSPAGPAGTDVFAAGAAAAAAAPRQMLRRLPGPRALPLP